jgi:hypothetical protein
MMIPKGRFLLPVSDPARIMGKMGKIQGEMINANPSRKPNPMFTIAVCINNKEAPCISLTLFFESRIFSVHN